MGPFLQRQKPRVGCVHLLLFVFCIAFISLFHACTTVHKPEPPGATVSTELDTVVRDCQREYGDIPWLTTEDFYAGGHTEEWVIIDARSEEERKISVIPGAMSVEEFEADIEIYRKRSMLVYCTVGCRSGAYVRTLQSQGLSAFNLWGGVLDWAGSGREFVSPDGLPTRSVHVFGEKWNILPPGYEGIW